MRRGRGYAGILAAAVLVVLVGCSKPPTPGHQRSPTSSPSSQSPEANSRPLPPIPSESGGGQAPVIWVGGTLTSITNGQLALREALGPRIDLKRLGQNATAFFRAIAGSWQRVDPETAVASGDRACVETLLDGQNLLALRVFLGADCGPTA